MIKKIYSILLALSLMVALPVLGMENETYPCDNCQKPQKKLQIQRQYKCNISCMHTLCNPCFVDIVLKYKPTHDNNSWDCLCCIYFFHEKNKLCCQTHDTSIDPDEVKKECFELANAGDRQISILNEKYPNRTFPDVTDTTKLPLLKSASHAPSKPIHTVTYTKDKIIISNKNLDWVYLGIAGVVCYAAYKAYTWYTNKDVQEKDSELDDEQKDEVKPAEQT